MANIQSPKNRGIRKPGAKAPELQFRTQRQAGYLVSCMEDLVLLMSSDKMLFWAGRHIKANLHLHAAVTKVKYR